MIVSVKYSIFQIDHCVQHIEAMHIHKFYRMSRSGQALTKAKADLLTKENIDLDLIIKVG